MGTRDLVHQVHHHLHLLVLLKLHLMNNLESNPARVEISSTQEKNKHLQKKTWPDSFIDRAACRTAGEVRTHGRSKAGQNNTMDLIQKAAEENNKSQVKNNMHKSTQVAHNRI